MVQKIKNLIVDTTAFINNAPLHEIAENIYTVEDVVNEITNKRQLRRLVVLPYDLQIKDVFTEHVRFITEFAKKTGDYPSLSATDIQVMALTYQLEKEKVGTSHLNTAPKSLPNVKVTLTLKQKGEVPANVAGFYAPNAAQNIANDQEGDSDEKGEDLKDVDLELTQKFAKLDCEEFVDVVQGEEVKEVLTVIKDDSEEGSTDVSDNSDDEDNDDSGWITPQNIKTAQKQLRSELVDEDANPPTVACITTDFAMQNVLKQIGLHIAALDGREIKQVRTFILRCYSCFKTTSLMTKQFCPKCGNKTLKKVSVTVDESGNQHIHINARKPISTRGTKFSLPTFKGGKHSNNPVVNDDQPQPQQRPSRQARMRNNPLDPDYIAGYSPFVMRDVNSRSALLGIRPDTQFKHWMKKNPNEARRKRK